MTRIKNPERLTFVVVRSKEGSFHYHLTNLYDVTLGEGESIVSCVDVPLKNEDIDVFSSLISAIHSMTPLEQLPDDSIANFLEVIFKSGFQAGSGGAKQMAA